MARKYEHSLYSAFKLYGVLGGETEEILKWAIGDDWEHYPMKYWYLRINENLGVGISKNASFIKSMEWLRKFWEVHKN